ncbi:MAG: hypothetical protein KC550_03625, partial [Nanoarchaeota archaeon]|nr:hypothetical protein [Nanoarchaeota archaeon]
SLIWFSMILFEDFFKNLIVNKPLFYLIILFLPVGVALLFSFLNKNISNDVFIAILLSTWIAGTIYMSLNGVRFILLLLPAFTVAFGIGLFYICEYINKFFFGSNYKLDNLFSKKSLPGILTVMILFIILYVPVFTQANGISNGTYPNFDDAWYSSMYKIRDNSSEDAIITSWWDFGHFFAITSERGVTFDGGSQTTPRSHWVGKLLMENDELKSHDILRMLVCGGNEAHNVMLSKTSGTSADAVKVNKIIYLTLGKNVDETRKVLKENVYYDFSESDIDEIMLMLKCDSPSENFLVTSGDMVGKAGVWAHWGSWDFTRKYVYDNYNLMKVEDMAEKIDGNVSLIDSYVKQLKQIDIDSKTKNLKRDDLINQWLAPYPSYIPLEGKYQYPCVNSNNTLICQNSIQIDLENGNIKSGFGEDVTFNRVVFPISMDEMGEMKIDENGNFDVLLIPSSNGNYNVMLMQFPLGNSLFTKLYYLNGFGTKQFEKFDDVTSVSGVNVKVWKTNWDVVEELPFELDLSSLIGNQTLEFDIDSEDLDLIGEDSNSSDINPSDN